MADLLLLTDRVINTIQLGESDFREFKSAYQGPPDNKQPGDIKKLKQYIAEALVAFANSDGGELLIGVEDDGTITGIPHGDVVTQDMLLNYRDYLHPETQEGLLTTHAARLKISERLILFFSILKSTTEIFQLSDGRCVRRKGKATVPASLKQITSERQEIRSREYDRTYVDGARVADLNTRLVQATANDYLAGLGVERYLQQMELGEYDINGLRLKQAAVLLFAQDIGRWHPRSQVRILKVAGTALKSGAEYNGISDESIQGNITELIEKSWDRLKPFLASKTEFGPDARFEQRYLYPESAVREALVNAIAHRDYSIQNGVEIFVFDDRIEIKSPGALLSTLTLGDLEELQGAHESRNALTARVLRESKYMRELGEGIKRMFSLMADAELQKPRLHSNGTSFSVTLSSRSIFTDQQEAWLALFQEYPLISLQKRIVVAGMNKRELSKQDIQRAINTEDRTTYDNAITPLRHLGILQQIRSQQQAAAYARTNQIAKNRVPRFRVQTPSENSSIDYQRITRPSIPRRADPDPDLGVYVTNLPYRITQEEVQEAFGKIGRIRNIHMPIDRDSGEPRGYAFVWYDSADNASRAIEQLNGMEFGSRILRVAKYRPRV